MSSFINLHTHKIQTEAICITNCFPEQAQAFINLQANQYCSVGLHPWYINTQVEASLSVLKQSAMHTQVMAIGETGLDKACITPFPLQLAVFKEHIELSEQYGKPLIIHCVKAFNELLILKKEMQPAQAWILHGFRGKASLAQQLLEHGFYFSFGQGLELLQKTINALPIERIFLETDDAPCSIQSRYALLASFKGISVEALKQLINDNFSLVFLHTNE